MVYQNYNINVRLYNNILSSMYSDNFHEIKNVAME